MELTGWAIGQFLVFTLIFVRMTGMVFFTPFFDETAHPLQLKAGLSGLLAILVMGTAGREIVAGAPDSWSLAFYLSAAFLEFGVGFIIGLVANLVMQGVQLAGQQIGRDMGLDMANLIDPEQDLEISIISHLKWMLFLAVFMGLDGHHVFVRAVACSYEAVPFMGLTFSRAALELFLREGAFLMALSVELAAPVIAAGLLANLIMGIVGRTVPQLNIFIIGFPVRIVLGMAVFLLSLGMVANVADNLAARCDGKVRAALYLSRPAPAARE